MFLYGREFILSGGVTRNEDKEVNRACITKDLICHLLRYILQAMRSHLRLVSNGMTHYSRSNMEEGVGGTGH